jgi:hypothetical protein
MVEEEGGKTLGQGDVVERRMKRPGACDGKLFRNPTGGANEKNPPSEARPPSLTKMLGFRSTKGWQC